MYVPIVRPAGIGILLLVVGAASHLRGDEVDPVAVRTAIASGRIALTKEQHADGYWQSSRFTEHTIGTTSLVTLALINTGMSARDPEIERALGWLRQQRPSQTKEISLMIEALVAVGDKQRDDFAKIETLADQLQSLQCREGPDSGSWPYSKVTSPGADNANACFAIRGLWEAARVGVAVNAETWHRSRAHWLESQNPDGTWSYRAGRAGYGSMTCAGIESLLIIQNATTRKDSAPREGRNGNDGTAAEKAIDRAFRWIANQPSIYNNPGDGHWLLFYLDALGRAGKISKRQFLIDSRGTKYPWFEGGATYLVQKQNRVTGTWTDNRGDTVLDTSWALMFLSRGAIDK